MVWLFGYTLSSHLSLSMISILYDLVQSVLPLFYGQWPMLHFLSPPTALVPTQILASRKLVAFSRRNHFGALNRGFRFLSLSAAAAAACSLGTGGTLPL